MLLQLKINEKIFLRDPQETELGRKIISKSIAMIDTMGLEAFTFKKLSAEIDSTEASIYRYFENKHKLLVYLIAWYWHWLEYRLVFCTNNIPEAADRLKKIINLITEEKSYDDQFENVDETALQRIVINEFDKTFLNKNVDEYNKSGSFRAFKSLCEKVADVILEINPDYLYAHTLASTAIEAAHHQIFFNDHLPRLTDHHKLGDNPYEQNYEFILHMITKTISKD